MEQPFMLMYEECKIDTLVSFKAGWVSVRRKIRRLLSSISRVCN